VNRYGYPFLKTIDAPRSYMNDRDVGDITYGGSWDHDLTDISAFKATYSSANADNASAQASFTGVSVLL